MAPGDVVDRMNAMLGTGADMAPGTGGAPTPAVNILEEAAWAAMNRVLPCLGVARPIRDRLPQAQEQRARRDGRLP
jgi:hypothetical protein